MPAKALTTGEIARALDLELLGDESVRISRISSLQNAVAGSISFIVNKNKLELLSDCKATALIVPAELIGTGVLPSSVVLFPSDNPYLSYARLTQFWTLDNNQPRYPLMQVLLSGMESA